MTDDVAQGTPPAKPRKVLRVLLRLAVGVGIVYFLLRRYDVQSVLSSMAEARPSWILASWLCATAAMYSLAHAQRVSFHPLGTPFTTTYMLKLLYEQRFHGLFMPGGMAVVMRWYRIMKPSGQPALTAVLLAFNRLIAMGSLFLVTAIAIALDAQFPWPSLRITIPLLLLGVCVTIGLLVVFGMPRALLRLWHVIPLHQKLRASASRWAQYPKAIRRFSARDMAALAALSILTQIGFVAEQYLIAHAIDINIPFIAFGWIGAVSMFCMAIPISPGGLGIREASMAGLMTFYGVEHEHAIAFSLLFYAAGVLFKGVIGGVLEAIDQFRALR